MTDNIQKRKAVVAISETFFEAFARLKTAQAQRKTQQFLRKFQQDPYANGLNLEKLGPALNGFRSARVSDRLRAIIFKADKEEVFLLLWVDDHDPAYAWAGKHVCTLNQMTGSLQVYETITEQVSIPEP